MALGATIDLTDGQQPEPLVDIAAQQMPPGNSLVAGTRRRPSHFKALWRSGEASTVVRALAAADPESSQTASLRAVVSRPKHRQARYGGELLLELGADPNYPGREFVLGHEPWLTAASSTTRSIS